MTLTPVRPDPNDVDAPPVAHTVLVDDHRLLTQSLAMALELEGISCTIADLRDRDTLLNDVLALAPGLVLLDLDLGPGIGDGSLLVAPLVEAGFRVLVVSASTDREQVCRALEAGAAGMLDKSAPFPQLLDAVLAAARGEDVMPAGQRLSLRDEVRRQRMEQATRLAPFERLSGREAEVLRALGEGLSVGVIARTWFVSEATVRSQVRSVLTKLGVGSQLEAVAMAHRIDWR